MLLQKLSLCNHPKFYYCHNIKLQEFPVVVFNKVLDEYSSTEFHSRNIITRTLIHISTTVYIKKLVYTFMHKETIR